MTAFKLPDWVSYPKEEWTAISPEQAGIDVREWEAFLAESSVRGADQAGEATAEKGRWGTVLTRGGYLVHAWGDRDYKEQTASASKAFTWAVLGLAVDSGLLNPDEPICKTWTGEGLLSHPHKYLDRGHHVKLTWRHILGRKDGYGHYGGFPVTNGYFWRNRTPESEQSPIGVQLYGAAEVPAWAEWTGDPFYDNYAHTEPGTVTIYSTGGLWRLTQSLTALWNADIKEVLDHRLFSRIGIPADRWDWTPGGDVYHNQRWYSSQPGYGDYIDPPYEINGHIVRGPGWAVISASDMARFGHLIATQGVWKGEQLISPQWLRGHHGGDSYQVAGESAFYTAMGRVATLGIDHPLPAELFAGPVRA